MICQFPFFYIFIVGCLFNLTFWNNDSFPLLRKISSQNLSPHQSNPSPPNFPPNFPVISLLFADYNYLLSSWFFPRRFYFLMWALQFKRHKVSLVVQSQWKLPFTIIGLCICSPCVELISWSGGCKSSEWYSFFLVFSEDSLGSFGFFFLELKATDIPLFLLLDDASIFMVVLNFSHLFRFHLHKPELIWVSLMKILMVSFNLMYGLFVCLDF